MAKIIFPKDVLKLVVAKLELLKQDQDELDDHRVLVRQPYTYTICQHPGCRNLNLQDFNLPKKPKLKYFTTHVDNYICTHGHVLCKNHSLENLSLTMGYKCLICIELAAKHKT